MSAAVQDQSEATTTQMSFPVSPHEAEAIKLMANSAGLSVGAFLRRQVLAPAPSSEEAEALKVADELIERMHADVRRAIDAVDASLGRMGQA